MSIDLSERLSRYSWAGYNEGGVMWHRVPRPTAYFIGDTSMVEYQFTTEVPLREVTVEFNTSGNVHDPLARYSMEKPNAIHDADGTAVTIAKGVNAITVTGNFLPGVTYSLWVWGTNAWTVTLGNMKAAYGELGGIAHYDNGAGWDNLIPYYDNGSEWVQLIPYYDNGTGWEVLS